MAIVQISRITQRKGLQANLPQLAGAEFGWSIDERRLFIGNGTLAEGAPIIGNTEILTEFSDILEFQTTYTYKGEAAGYTAQTGPTPSTPVTQSLQSWFDQFATVKDFGAVGDGVTDDTEAINRALYQIYCRQNNVASRRALFFPAGTYLISETIIIPPYATLYGEGQNNSIIQMRAGDDSALRAYVARTGDSLQQTGVNIGAGGATTPHFVTITDMAFKTLDTEVDCFLVEDAININFKNIGFYGPLTKPTLTSALNPISGITFASTASLVCRDIVIDKCNFQGLTYGVYADQETHGVVIQNSKFDTLYKGVALGIGTPVNGGPTATKVLHSYFNNIYSQGIEVGDIELTATGYNYFDDVGNEFNGVANPSQSIIKFVGPNSISIGDMFERSTADALLYPTIDSTGTDIIYTDAGRSLNLGTYRRQSGNRVLITDNSSNTVTTTKEESFSVDYTIERNVARRKGVLTITNVDGTGLTWNDEYTENTSTGVTLGVSQSGGTVTITYTSSSTGFDGYINYSINSFNY